MKILLFFICLSLAAQAEIIRLSHVVSDSGPGISRFEIKNNENSQVVFVEDKPIITEADIETATPSLHREDALSIELSAAGTEKMIRIS